MNNKTWTKKLVLKVTAVALLGSVAVDCGSRDPHFALVPTSQGYIANVPSNKVDILWIIDNSGSMGPKQTNLANSIHSFIDQFTTKGFDFQIAVTTTDIRPVDPNHPTDPNYSGQGACFVGSPKILVPSTPNVASALATNANVGFFGAADAHGLDAARLALSNPNISNCNVGFLRPDAFLAVIEFSDADDDTTATVDALMTAMDGIRPPMTLANGTQIRSYMFSAMVVDDLSKPSCQALGPFSELGSKYIDAANRTHGTVASICDSDFSAGLLNVGTKILEASTAIHLTRVPDPTTIQISYGGTSVPNNSGNGWTYDSGTNTITFHGSAIPTGQTVLTVNFTPVDIVR